MRDDPFGFYRLLADLPFLQSYRSKFVAVVVAALGLDALALTLVVIFGAGRVSAWGMIAVIAALGVATAIAILWAVDRLLRPLALASRALDALSENVDLPRMELPGTDEAAQILRGVQNVIGRVRREEDRARSASEQDELTGLYQRRAGRARAQALLESETRRGGAVRVVVADVEGMRAFNARFGHGQGDALLRALAARIAHVAGERGVAVRWSGDRFLLVLPEGSEAASAPGEVLGRPFVIKGSEQTVRLAWAEVTATDPTPVDDLVARAEATLGGGPGGGASAA